MKQKVLIELIINNQCNKRCEYCDLDFRNKNFSHHDLDRLIYFLKENKDEVKYFYINFFGWEPLLSYEEIKYFVLNVGIKNIKYSVWTNWVFLDEDKLNFFREHNFNIYLSVDNIDWYDFLKDKDFEIYEDMFQVNFINDPDFLHKSTKTFDLIRQKWFKTINFMPVLSTKNWYKESLVNFLKIKKYVSSFNNLNLNYFSYYNWFSSDIQFILDTDLFFYKDLDSLIWLQKQYKIVPEYLRNKLNDSSRLFSLERDNFTLKDLINNYNEKDIFDLVMEIPKVIWTLKTNLIIDKIVKNGT